MNVGKVILPDGSTAHFDIDVTAQSYIPYNPNLNGLISSFARISFGSNTESRLSAHVRPMCGYQADSCKRCDGLGDQALITRCYEDGCSCFGEQCTTEGCCSGGELPQMEFCESAAMGMALLAASLGDVFAG